MDFASQYQLHLKRVERGIAELLPDTTVPATRIHEAMRYSMQAGGKRLRPVICIATASQLGGSAETAVAAAVAIECIHTYSLIHDDLPCMDNDDLRRGRPTCHKAYDEATALLAGDALLTEAFVLLSTRYQSAMVAPLVKELSDAASSRRLIGGQMEDLLAEKKSDATAAQLEFIHLNKTSAMIEASFVMGGILASAESPVLDELRRLGRHLGLAFQIIDDILDATADTATLGKTAGKDAKVDKTTYVKLHGLDGARRHAETHTAKAAEALSRLPGDQQFMRALVDSMLVRKN